ncbi:alpha/beta hydrolase [Nodosilinea sp. LEGE 06152]|uniref:alpha/beta hydrolase n=1 Tax=Nodosilinea sp. LEGE 06152 TaxID=2777966 RepID=UPI001881F8A1|nr:alpha/beta hydrolase [Nodosilinea sp. LEGE 06152]MBE9158513.1 alpha/beta hydrolase [Nodosilinea sp. LEGE 06152]
MHQFLQVADQLFSSSSALLHRLGQGTATLALVGASLAGLAVAAPQATAADNIQITYGALEAPPIAVSDLESFARTGIPSRDLQLLLNILRIEEDQARQVLTQNVLVDADSLRDGSNTFAGQFIWRLLATTLTFSDNDSPGWELLRNAVLDTAASGELTILDVLRTIEATTLQVDGRRVMAIASQIDFERFGDLAAILLGK